MGEDLLYEITNEYTTLTYLDAKKKLEHELQYKKNILKEIEDCHKMIHEITSTFNHLDDIKSDDNDLYLEANRCSGERLREMKDSVERLFKEVKSGVQGLNLSNKLNDTLTNVQTDVQEQKQLIKTQKTLLNNISFIIDSNKKN